MSGANPKIRATLTKVERTIVNFLNNSQTGFSEKKDYTDVVFTISLSS